MASGSSKGFDIKKAGLRDFSAGLTANVDRHVRPERDAITTVFEAGVPFGRFTASPVVQQLMRDYWLRMSESIDFITTHIHNAEVMAQAAHVILTNYEDADTLTNSDLSTIVDNNSYTIGQADSQATIDARKAEGPTSLDQRHGHGGTA